MLNKELSNRELVDGHYDLAGEQLRKKITDWSNYNLWRSSVYELDEKLKGVYLIGVLNQQVLNGGFSQYFDNSYGMFGYETLEVLNAIDASESANLLEQALKIVYPKGLRKSEFSEYIAINLVDEETDNELEKLDDQYYALDGHEDLEELLANWIKN